MHGFGSHTFSMINAADERVWVKLHFRTQHNIENLTDAEAQAIVAKDREATAATCSNDRRGRLPALDAFHSGDDRGSGETHRPFDLTRVWPKAEYLLIEVGVMELNRYPGNYFAEGSRCKSYSDGLPLGRVGSLTGLPLVILGCHPRTRLRQSKLRASESQRAAMPNMGRGATSNVP
jgi:hypothetical protein